MSGTGTVSALFVRPLLEVFGDKPPTEFWDTTGLTSEIVADPQARLSMLQFAATWNELARLTNDPQIALRVAATILPVRVGTYGVFEYLCRSAATYGDSLRLALRYFKLLDDVMELDLVEDGDDVCLRIIVDRVPPVPAANELGFLMVAVGSPGLCARPFRATRVDFTHRAPGDIAAYRRWFQAPVRFGAEHDQLVIPRALLTSPMRAADPNLTGILTHYADHVVAQDSGATMISHVRRVLSAAFRNRRSGQIRQIAHELGLTQRSLQRRLKDEGSSFQVVRDEVRRDLAISYLERQLPVAEIAFLIGFSEPSAFCRAFKRWTGVPPLESRSNTASRR